MQVAHKGWVIFLHLQSLQRTDSVFGSWIRPSPDLLLYPNTRMTQEARAGDRHQWAPDKMSSCRAVHPVCGSTAITGCQTTAKHSKEDVWWQESPTSRVRLPGPLLSTHHRYTSVVWCPATWTVLLNRGGIFMCFTLDLHLITLIIRAKFPSRSDASSSLRTSWFFSMYHFRISHSEWNELL